VTRRYLYIFTWNSNSKCDINNNATILWNDIVIINDYFRNYSLSRNDFAFYNFSPMPIYRQLYIEKMPLCKNKVVRVPVNCFFSFLIFTQHLRTLKIWFFWCCEYKTNRWWFLLKRVLKLLTSECCYQIEHAFHPIIRAC
jgi:hypothetical protein